MPRKVKGSEAVQVDQAISGREGYPIASGLRHKIVDRAPACHVAEDYQRHIASEHSSWGGRVYVAMFIQDGGLKPMMTAFRSCAVPNLVSKSKFHY